MSTLKEHKRATISILI